MKPPNRKTTIYDIARISGASPSTVSAVINGTWMRRRISPKTVEMIRKVADDQGYSINMQARGLRRAQSGMVGMIIPLHENRFFSSLSQTFDTLARERGLCPVIASTLRNPAEERRVVETLISYAVDALFIVGASDPEQLGELCTAANMKHIYVDLPGKDAPSVITDNYGGARRLTRRILSEMPRRDSKTLDRPYFLGGSASDYATARRIEAFRQTAHEAGYSITDSQIIECGYAPRSAAEAVANLRRELGGLPGGVFVNSFTVFEGVTSHLMTLPPEAVAGSAIGCFDYDPFAAFLQFPVHMIRQDSQRLISKAYELLDEDVTGSVVFEVEPELIEPRTFAIQDLTSVG